VNNQNNKTERSVRYDTFSQRYSLNSVELVLDLVNESDYLP